MTFQKSYVYILFLCIPLTTSAHFGQKRTFHLTDDPIDVVIVAVNKGRSEYCIESIKKFGQNIRDIYIISPQKVTDKAIWIDEKIFPFDIPGVALHLLKDEARTAKYLEKGKGRIGWYLQQLLKLYAHRVIPNISPNILILDSDVIFLRPIHFMNEKSEPFFCKHSQHHRRYFRHGAKLLPGFKRHKHISGISHHMLFQKDPVEQLLSLIEKTHGKPAWQAMCESVDLYEDGRLTSTGFSEYELYFNFFLASGNQGHIRNIKWKNVSKKRAVWQNIVNLEELKKYEEEGYYFISRH